MKFEIETQDIEAIAQRVSEIIKPLLTKDKGQGETDTVFSTKEVASYLKVNISWIYKQVSLRAIPYFKAGKFPRFRKRDIDRWMESKAVRPVPSLKVVKNKRVAT